MSSVRYRVKLFAGLADAFEASEIDCEFEEAPTARGLLDRLSDDHPAASALLGASRVAASAAFLGADDVVPTGAEVAIIPPVSGG